MRPCTLTSDWPGCVCVWGGGGHRQQALVLRLLVGPIHRGIDCGAKSSLKIKPVTYITHVLTH